MIAALPPKDSNEESDNPAADKNPIPATVREHMKQEILADGADMFSESFGAGRGLKAKVANAFAGAWHVVTRDRPKKESPSGDTQEKPQRTLIEALEPRNGGKGRD